MGSAWAAGSEHAAEPSFFANPETWVAVAFVLFVALLGKVLWGRITALLDKRASDITRGGWTRETTLAKVAERLNRLADAIDASDIALLRGGEPARVQARHILADTPHADLTMKATCRKWASDWRDLADRIASEVLTMKETIA